MNLAKRLAVLVVALAAYWVALWAVYYSCSFVGRGAALAATFATLAVAGGAALALVILSLRRKARA